MPPTPLQSDELAVFFDGDCNLCNGSVNFLIDHDRDRRLRYASLQSSVAADLLAGRPEVDLSDLDTVAVLKNGEVLVRSAAVLAVAAALPYPYRLGGALRLVPRALRDGAYRLVARNRKRLWRRPRSCRMPDPDRLTRFLD